MSKLNYFERFSGLPRIVLPLLSLISVAVQELGHQAIASSSFSSPMQDRETSINDPAKELSVAPTNISNSTASLLQRRFVNASPYAIAPPETLDASPFSPPADQLKQAQASQRFLQVERVRGTVTYSMAGAGDRLVQVGDRLSAGEGELLTGRGSSVDLALDNHMGLVEVLENTSLQIKSLSGSDDHNSETVFFVNRGQVRLSLRPIQSASSDVSEGETPIDGTQEHLLARAYSSGGKTVVDSGEAPLLAQRRPRRNYPVRVETPAGIAGVRGTSFGVNVGPDGKTGIEIIKGSIAAIAQDEEVIFQGGESVVILPGESPAQPSPWQSTELARLRIRSLVRTSPSSAIVSGQVNPMDIVFLNGKPIEIDSEGKFKVAVALPSSHRLNFVVQGPAVRARSYRIVVP